MPTEVLLGISLPVRIAVNASNSQIKWNWQVYRHCAEKAGAGVWVNHVTGPERAEDAVAKLVSCRINNREPMGGRRPSSLAGWRFAEMLEICKEFT
jgi:hypothetical protein